MYAILRQTMRANDGSAIVIALLVILSLSILAAGFSLVTNTETTISSMQQVETKAFYIAQTAMDRSVKELLSSPGWRDGFSNVAFDNGKYSVKIYDSTNDGKGTYDPTLPKDYVRIVATSDIKGVKKEIEALWVNPVAAFNYAYSAGDQIVLHNHGTPSAVVTADMHNNSWDGGSIGLDGGTTVYGNVTAVGDITLKKGSASAPCLVYGNVWGRGVSVEQYSEVRKYQNLDEGVIGRDLNGDGDATDTGLTKGLAEVSGETFVKVNGTNLSNAQTHSQVASGTQPVAVGATAPAPIVDPRADFKSFYDLTTGSAAYPPGANHVVTPIPGDGDGHYFASQTAFKNWLNTQGTKPVVCWRCAGDGKIKPDNSMNCPNCGGTGFDSAVEVTGVFYVDDSSVDLSSYNNNLVIHGSIVVAQGNPNTWPSMTVDVPGGQATIERFPTGGSFSLKGGSRKHFTQTYRSSDEGGAYNWNIRAIYTGNDTQYLPIPEPAAGKAMRDFPSIITPMKINMNPAGISTACCQGDIGGEKLTILQGVMYAEGEVHMHGSGGNNSFYSSNGYEFPVLLYHEGVLLSQKLHTCEHYLIVFDPLIVASGIPFGFRVDFGNSYQGLVSWRENTGK